MISKISKNESSFELTNMELQNKSSRGDNLKHKKTIKSNCENANFAHCGALSSFVVETSVCSVRVSHCASGLHEFDLFNEGDLPESSSEKQFVFID